MRYRLFLIGLTVIAFTACSSREHAARQQAPLKVQTMVVERGTYGASSRYVGTVEAAHETPLSMQIAGRVTAVQVKNGERVNKGQTLLVIDDTQVRNALVSSEAALRHAQDGFDRVKQVHAKGVVSDQKMVEIESQLAQAKAMYAAAQRQLEECSLMAPCDGVVQGLEVQPGQTIVPGVRLCSLMDVTGFSIRFAVPEAEIKDLACNGEMYCAAVDATLPIRVVEKSMKASQITHTYDVIANIDGGSDSLMDGMVGVVTISDERLAANDVFVIPVRCVLLKPEGYTVWLMKNGIAERRTITAGGYLANGVQVTDGLQAGDTLITDGYQKLYNGCPVTMNNE